MEWCYEVPYWSHVCLWDRMRQRWCGIDAIHALMAKPSWCQLKKDWMKIDLSILLRSTDMVIFSNHFVCSTVSAEISHELDHLPPFARGWVTLSSSNCGHYSIFLLGPTAFLPLRFRAKSRLTLPLPFPSPLPSSGVLQEATLAAFTSLPAVKSFLRSHYYCRISPSQQKAWSACHSLSGMALASVSWSWTVRGRLCLDT